MKRAVVFFLSILALLPFFASCEKETFLTVDQTSVSIPDTGGSQTIALTANKPWTASADQSWCKVSPSAGEEAASTRITITCDANTTYDARSATVTFTCAELTKQISISQATNNGLLVSQTSYEVSKAAQQLNIQVQANVKFSVEVDNSCKDWVKYNTTKGLTTSTVVLDIAENKTYDSREGKVTIKQDGGSLSSTITIKQSQLDGLFLTTSDYNLSNEKHTLTVEVSANVEFNVNSEVDWVKYIQTKGLNKKQIILEVAENDTYDQREAKVNVKQKNGDLSGVITIKQDEKYGILVTQSEHSLTNEAQTIDVEVKYNVDYSVVIPEESKEWIKQVSTKSLDSKTYTFYISKNESYDNRESSITFKQTNGPNSATVSIKQAQTDYLEVSKTDFIADIEGETINIEVTSNVDYAVSIEEDAQSWLSVLGTKGLSKENVSIVVSPGDDNTDRTGIVLITYGELYKIIRITQRTGPPVEFDDNVFKTYCLLHFDKNGDGEISLKEARAVKKIDIRSAEIQSLTGVESFTNLEELICYPPYDGGDVNDSHYDYQGSTIKGGLKKIDLHNNSELRVLDCRNHLITELDLSNNPKIETVICCTNPLTTLIIDKCPQLRALNINSTLLIDLNLTTFTKLEVLECANIGLTSIDVTIYPELRELNINNNKIVTIDLSKNPKLQSFEAWNNNLSALDIRNNPEIRYIWCPYNRLTELNTSNNPAITHILAWGNSIKSIDITKNTKITNLNIDYNNDISVLDISNNPELFQLSIDYTKISSLDLSNCPKLTNLYCNNCEFEALDLSKLSSLQSLWCCGNKSLTTLDVSNNSLLQSLGCYDCPLLTELWLKTGQTIQQLSYDSEVTTIKYK